MRRRNDHLPLATVAETARGGPVRWTYNNQFVGDARSFEAARKHVASLLPPPGAKELKEFSFTNDFVGNRYVIATEWI
jgi:hypothetical protein